MIFQKPKDIILVKKGYKNNNDNHEVHVGGCCYQVSFDIKQIQENRKMFVFYILAIVFYLICAIDRIINLNPIDIMFLFFGVSLCLTFSLSICLMVNKRFYYALLFDILISYGFDIGYILTVGLQDEIHTLSYILFFPFLGFHIIAKSVVIILLFAIKSKILPLSQSEKDHEYAIKQINEPVPDKNKTQVI